jgi:hypothetical protein
VVATRFRRSPIHYYHQKDNCATRNAELRNTGRQVENYVKV